MATQDSDINWAIFLQHMQGMEQRLRDEILSVKEVLTQRIDRHEAKTDRHEQKTDQQHAQTMAALDTIDARLDDVEVIQIPKLKKAVGIR